MTARELEAKATLVLPADVFLVLRLQLAAQMDAKPTREGAAILLGQMALETGRFKASQNYNLGGIKCPAKWPGCWQHFTTTERLPMVTAQKYLAGSTPEASVEIVTRDGDLWTIRFRGKHAVNKFVAFESLSAAVEHHVAFLLGRYRESVAIAMQGDAVGYANSLYRLGYYTGSREDYGRSLVSLGREYDRTMPQDVATIPPPSLVALPVALAASVAAFQAAAPAIAAPTPEDTSVTLQLPVLIPFVERRGAVRVLGIPPAKVHWLFRLAGWLFRLWRRG